MCFEEEEAKIIEESKLRKQAIIAQIDKVFRNSISAIQNQLEERALNDTKKIKECLQKLQDQFKISFGDDGIKKIEAFTGEINSLISFNEAKNPFQTC